MDRVTKSRPITPKRDTVMAPLTQLYFQKDFLRGPHPSPPPHAYNFYINFKPLSCIKLFCGRERCVWGGGATGLSGSAGGLGSAVSRLGAPRAGVSSSQPPRDGEEDAPQLPLPRGRTRTWWSPQPGPRPPVPCPCACIPRPSTARHTLPPALGVAPMCANPQGLPNLAGFMSFLFVSFELENLVFFEK